MIKIFRKSLLVLFVGYLVPLQAVPQSLTLSPNSTKVWAGETVEYTRSSVTGCTEYGWQVSLGVFPEHQNATSITQPSNSTKIKVKWDLTSLQNGVVTVNCGTISQSVSNVAILSLFQRNIGNISSSSNSIPYCSTSPRTFSTAIVRVPYSEPNAQSPQIPASGYEWTIPPGWTGPSGQTGTFRIDNVNANSVQLTPDGCTGGQVRVRAYTNTEGKGTPHYSNYSAWYTVTRTMPEITTSTSEIRCKVPFTASIPALSCATSYTWNVPVGWQVSGSGASVTITPTNTNGTISVTANLSGSCPSQTVSKAIEITNDIQQISGADNGACATTYSAGTLPTGSTVAWTYSTNLQRINPGSSAALQVIPTNPSSYAPGWVKATVTNPNGCNFEKIKNIWVGIPGLPSVSFQSFNVYGGGTFTAPSFAGAVTGYTWTVSSSLTIVSGGGPNDSSITVSINSGQTFGDIFVRARNSCGSSQQPSQIRVNRIQSFSYSVYPNPADTELTVEVEKMDSSSRELKPIEVKFYDEAGNELFTQLMEADKNKIPVSRFKNGFYYLHIISEEGITKKKIRIER